MSRRAAGIDETFFDEWSVEMAWVLGLLYTDGNLRVQSGRTPARLSFSQKSPELLEKIKVVTRSDTVVHFSPRRVYNAKTAGAIYRFQLCNAKICDRLVELGLTPRKSLTLGFPDVPSHLVRHFIRGCWDGDGSVLRSVDRRSLIAKFGCGSRSFVEGMLEALYLVGLPRRQIYQLRRGGKEVSYYSLYSNGSKMIQKLFRYLYDGVPESLYLTRKHALFTEQLARHRHPDYGAGSWRYFR